MKAIRLQVPGSAPNEVWLTNPSDVATLDVPGGRVTLRLNDWSESGIAFARLTFEPIRSGLVRFGEGPKARP